MKHRLAAFAFGILVVLVYSTGAELRGEAFDWSASARAALAAGLAWLLLVPVVIAADRRLPIARDVLYPRLLLHVPLSVVVSWAFAYVYYGASRALGAPVDPQLLAGPPLSAFHRFNWLVYWAVIGWYVASEYQDQARDRTVRTAELERLLTQSRLDTLRTQLHPHFLFNALNAISAHVESAPRTARWMLEQLGDLLRLALDHAEDQVIPLQRELAFVDRYMKLQKVRYEDRLDVVLDVDPLALQALVPTFILQPLLENAIRHGIATPIDAGPDRDPGLVRRRRAAPLGARRRAGPGGELGPRTRGRRRAVQHARAAQAPLRRSPELRDRGRGRRRRPGRPAVPAPARGRAARTAPRAPRRHAGSEEPAARERGRDLTAAAWPGCPRGRRRDGGDGGGRRRSSTAAP